MTFAGVLLICSGLVLARLATNDGVRPGWRSPWRWAAFLLMQWGLWGSLTRSAWVAAAAVVTVVVLVRRRRLLLAYLPAVALFVALAPVSWVQRGLSIVRSLIPSTTTGSAWPAPASGCGGTAFLRHRRRPGRTRYGISEATAPRFEVPHLHNAYLQIAAERGLVSLVAFLWLIGASLVAAVRGLRREGGVRGPRANLSLGTILAITAFCVAGLFENNWGDTEVQRVFLLRSPCRSS